MGLPKTAWNILNLPVEKFGSAGSQGDGAMAGAARSNRFGRRHLGLGVFPGLWYVSVPWLNGTWSPS